MSDDEVAAFLAASRKVQLGTINKDGTPHLVPMFYAMIDGRIAFWTYAKAQKSRNIERDPRVTCLVEAGEDYDELRGVMVYGTAERVDDPTEILRIGTAVVQRMTGVADVTPLREYIAHTARKRVGYLVRPTRVVSWDHRKLSAPGRR
jgi:PPOX class probable F420-dependent enzyme